MSLFVTNSTIANDDNKTITIDFEYYEYQNVRDSSNNYRNLRVTYEMCDEINHDNTSRYLCKLHAYERATSIDA